MAEAFLQIVLENLNSLIRDEIGLIMGIDEEMKKLFSTFTTIQAVLEDAEEKQLESKPIRNWLCKLNDIVYEIDDILDECATHVSKLKLRDGKMSGYSLKKILFRHNIGRRMKKVTESLDAVAAERAKFHLREMAVDKPREVAAARETGSILNESHQVYGRDEDKAKMVDILVNHARENKEITVLPITGVGGLGKTSLAQLVFNEQQVVEHFEKRLWICVSDNFDLKTLVKAMIESATGSGGASDLVQLDTLQRRLWELLNHKRYLLVLDDVWNTDQEKWFLLRNILACGSNGTSIIVTTRLKMVADVMGTLPSHCLKGLSEEHCWMLFRERAFGGDREEDPNLEGIGKEIVKKCIGVPMTAKALGGLLRFKRTEKEWNFVKKSEIWNLQPEETLILPALRLSYLHLPLALRQCFAYFSVFPKDFSIRKEELIRLWMAHGYISSRGILDVEDVGHEICNELILRSLFQYHPLNTDVVTMHDLVHDLAQSIMESKVPGVQVERKITTASNSTIRQVNLRTNLVAFPTCTQHGLDITSVSRKFSRLRVLDASRTKISDLPSTVGNLQHLRSLDLSRSFEILTLPNSLCSLWNLQILNLNECLRLVALPKNMRCLTNLRHLFLRYCVSLKEMPSKVGELTHLRTLSLFIVGLKRGNQLEELQRLNLGGRLEISHLERVASYIDAKKANLVDKKDLQYLSLKWQRKKPSRVEENSDEKVLEALEPHPSLETLSIEGFGGRSFPVWMANSTLEKVVDIKIVDCPSCSVLPQLGKLPHLKSLTLVELGMEYIIEDEVQDGSLLSIQFPSLETLVLGSLPNLKGIWKDKVSPNLVKLPHLKLLRLQQLAVEFIVEDEVPVDMLFPSLERLHLSFLPHLRGVIKEQVNAKVFPKLVELHINSCSSFVLPELPSLQDLWVQNCSCSLLSSFSNNDTLTYLSVTFDENMDCIPTDMLEKLTNLQSLSMFQPQEISLPEEGMRALKSLTNLQILQSEALTCLPQRWLQHLTAVVSLRIYACPNFVELPEEIKYLDHLEKLELTRVTKMVCLPEAVQHLSSLKVLRIGELPRLTSLPDWFGGLTSLQNLEVSECPKLVTLPACIGGMLSLQSLSIRGCPELERRCQGGTGGDWHMIAHIRHLKIGDSFYRT